MMCISNAWIVLLLLANHGKSIDAHAQHHVHVAGGGHVHARHLSQVAPAPTPSSAVVSARNPTANVTALQLGLGFKDAIVALVPKTANNSINSILGNTSQCGAAIREADLTVAKSMFLDILSLALQNDAIFQANRSYLRQWRSVLNDKVWMLEHYSAIGAAAKEYFNISLPTDFLKMVDAFSRLDISPRRTLKQLNNPSASSFKVPVYVVIVYDSTTSEGTTVSEASVQEQISVLNEGFKGTGFSFVLTGDVIKEDNGDYFTSEESSSLDFQNKAKLRKGGPESLNIYIRLPALPESLQAEGMHLLGAARFPEMLCSKGKINKDRQLDDGISLSYLSMPDQGYGFQGATLVHEVGHWLGLMHTFNQPSSCDPADGDFVSQTPVEQGPYNQNPNFVAGTCNTALDSCPNQPGTDPITNWMDYSPDECYTSFTQEQITIMQANYYHIRLNGQCGEKTGVSFFDAPGGDTPGTQSPGSGSNSATQWGFNSCHNMILALITTLAFICSIS